MTYTEARARAQALADELGFDHGVERVSDLLASREERAAGGSFRAFMLPRAEHRRGFELRCEVVHPSGAAQPGHGPTAQSTGPAWPLQQ